MGFVYEKVPEADWELYNSFKLRNYDRNGLKEANQFSQWTADRDRDIYFIFIGGVTLEMPEEYAIIWNGEKIIIYVERRSVVVNSTSREIQWSIDFISAPKLLMARKDELISIIEEVAYAAHDQKPTIAIQYSFVITHIAEPSFVDEVK